MRSELTRTALGLVAIAMVGAPVLYAMAIAEGPLATTRLALFWSSLAAFTAVYLAVAVRAAPPLGRGRGVIACALMSGLGLLANAILPMALPGVALTGILLAVAATMLVHLAAPSARVWLALQCAGLIAIYLTKWPMPIALAAGGAYAVLQVLVFGVSSLAEAEKSRRVVLEGMLRELRATQALLDEQTRREERAAIGRDLHDVMGHHLVALGLQLDAAMTAAPDEPHLVQARRLVRLLLADVRETVAEMRRDAGLDLGAALHALASEGPGPRVEIRIDPAAPRVEGELAVTLLRAAQEAITNARKHAGASTVRVELNAERLLVADDGRGRGDAAPGSGLNGIRERCEALGCTLSIGSPAGGGTSVAIGLPMAIGAGAT